MGRSCAEKAIAMLNIAGKGAMGPWMRKEPESESGITRRSTGVVPSSIGARRMPRSPIPTEVGQSIRLLEECKWRIILEHGPLGEVCAVAAFAPGPGDSWEEDVTIATFGMDVWEYWAPGAPMPEGLVDKIVAKQIPADIIYEDEDEEHEHADEDED